MVSLARLTRSQCLSTGGRSSASLFRTYVRSAVCHAPPQITPPTSVSLFRPHPVLRPASRRHVRVRGRSAALRGAADLPAAADAPGTCARTTCASAGGTFAAHQTPQVGTLQWHSEPLLSGRFFSVYCAPVEGLYVTRDNTPRALATMDRWKPAWNNMCV